MILFLSHLVVSSNFVIQNFTQYIDHNDTSAGTFIQKYYENLDNVNGKPSAAILVIGAETSVFHPVGIDDFYSVIAKRFNAIVVNLQHRYFGESFPTDLKLVNLDLLTVEQAIEDLANFRVQYAKDKGLDVPWIISGGSYPGLLSAVSRYVHSDLYAAAISASGVVYPILDFTDFDLQTAISMGQECASIARKANFEIEKLLSTDRDWVMKQFGVSDEYPLTDGQFLNYIGEIFTLGLQYCNISLFCGTITEASGSGKDVVSALAKYTRTWFKENGGDPNTYSTKWRRITDPIPDSSSRAWFWMTCNQLAWWQTYAGRLSLRSRLVDVKLFEDQCKDVFDIEMHPDVNAFYKKYPNLVQNTTHVFYSTASQDPWTWACATEDDDINPESVAYTYSGFEMGHHRDLSPASDNDPADLVRVRTMILKYLEKWLLSTNDEL